VFETPVAGKSPQVFIGQQPFSAFPPASPTKLPPTSTAPPTTTPTAVGHETHWLQHVCGNYAIDRY